MQFEELRQRFRESFPGVGRPQICRAPGRINLIGEHTDYNGLPVLPMAIAQEIRVAFCARNDDTINLHNVDPEFPDVSFRNAPDVPPSSPGAWDNYCKAAVQGLNRHLGVAHFPGVDALVSSTLPIAAGLSSSSALVVACALVYLKILGHALDDGISRLELAEVLAEAEHYVGTRGGGMDQAAILNGAREHTCKIDFFPLRVEIAPLPQECVIVVCDSTVKVKKSGAALARYNAGPRLCALACALVARQLADEMGETVPLSRLGDLWLGPLALTHQEARGLCMRAVPKPRTTLAEAATRLDCTMEEMRDQWLGDLPEPAAGFRLQARLRHLVTEYRRVERARDALLAGDSYEFGRLMNGSHSSCAKDFEISGPELDALVAAARKAGALGARLTGAGFGGATVNLVPRDGINRFVEKVTQAYYRDYLHREDKTPLFVAHASDGAGYA